MIKKLTAIGSSYALLLDKPILELYKVEPKETEFEIIPEADGLKIRPIRKNSQKEKIKELTAESHKKFGKMFKNLA